MPVNSLQVDCPAKINWLLNVTGPRPDGYHDVVTILQALASPALSDTLVVTALDEADQPYHLRTGDALLDSVPEQNLISRAYAVFATTYLETTGQPITDTLTGIEVQLTKRIPMQAGLGGGSSNAAAMLNVLNQLTGTPLTTEQLTQLARSLGADVPFFLQGGVALGAGRGDALTPIPGPGKPLTLLVVKDRHLASATAAAYQKLRQRNQYQTVDPQPMMEALQAGDPDAIEAALYNDFETVLMAGHPGYQAIISGLQQLGVRRPFLCGSGAAMAGLLRTPPDEPALAEIFPAEGFYTALAATAS